MKKMFFWNSFAFSMIHQKWRREKDAWPNESWGSPLPLDLLYKKRSRKIFWVEVSHASKVMLKILQTRHHQYKNQEFPDVQAGFRKGSRTRSQIVNIHWIMEKAREFQNGIMEFLTDIFFQYFEYVLLFSPGSKSFCLKFADKQMGFPCM